MKRQSEPLARCGVSNSHTLPRQVAEYIEGLTVAQGRRVGQPVELFPWQRRFLRGALSVEGDAGISLGRGGGKSTFTAGIACAALDGPLAEPGAEVMIVASAFEQAAQSIGFHVLAFMRPKTEAEPRRWRVQNSANRLTLEDRRTGTRLRILGSDPRRMHGGAPSLTILDEVAQWENPERSLAALETSGGKIPGARALWLGTRAASPDHPFERALQGGLEYVQIHAARPDDPPFQKRTWARACPSLPYMPDLEARVRLEAARARRDPSALASFRALRLNLGVADTVEAVLVDAGLWRGLETPELDSEGGGYVLGIDLGSSAAMSAAAAYFMASGGLDTFAVFPEIPTLAERGLVDGVGRRYLDMAARDELVIAGRRVSDVDALLRLALNRWGKPAAIVCDRWRQAELVQALERVGFPLAALVVRGQGYQDGGEDVRDFRKATLGGRVRPVRSLLLRSAMAEARTVTDAAGNSKLSKSAQGGRRLRARDDAAAAALLAVAVGSRRVERGNPEPEIKYAIV